MEDVTRYLRPCIFDLGLRDLTLTPQWGYPGMSQDIPWDILDLGLWDFTLPPQWGYPGMSQDILGHLGPGTLGLYNASTAGIFWVVPGYPRTSWTWDSLDCLHSWDIPWGILDLGLWDTGTLYAASAAGTSWDVLRCPKKWFDVKERPWQSRTTLGQCACSKIYVRIVVHK